MSLHGQYPFESPTYPHISMAWPKGMDVEFLYPEFSSLYTFPNGASYEVSCFTQEKEVAIQRVDCPDDFVNPVDPNHLKPRVKPCPVAVYTDAEYSFMWSIAGIVGIIGILPSIFMVTTWYVGGTKVYRAVPYHLKVCVYGALAYGLIETIPSLAMKVRFCKPFPLLC